MKILGRRIPLPEWGRQYGLHPQVTWRMYRDGRLPSYLVIEKLGNRLYVQVPEAETKCSRTVAYARVDSEVRAPDLVRQADLLQQFAVTKDLVIDELVMEIAPDLIGHRTKLLRLLADETVSILIVEHQDRITSFGFDMVEACFHARGGKIETARKKTIQNDILYDMNEMLVAYCARLYGVPSALWRAKKAIKAACEDLEQ